MLTEKPNQGQRWAVCISCKQKIKWGVEEDLNQWVLFLTAHSFCKAGKSGALIFEEKHKLPDFVNDYKAASKQDIQKNIHNIWDYLYLQSIVEGFVGVEAVMQKKHDCVTLKSQLAGSKKFVEPTLLKLSLDDYSALEISRNILKGLE